MARWWRLSAAYAFLAIIAMVIAAVWGQGAVYLHPEPWLTLSPLTAHAYSLGLGAALGAAVVASTRMAVPRFRWARRLHAELRPLAHGLTLPGIVMLALFSALGEELLFRGVLMPWLGLVAQALVFGIVHQLPGASRWVWVLWATVMGLALGAIFQLSGSLLGPLLAHALVNGLNLAYLKAHNPEPAPRTLGGLLGQRG